MQILNLSIKDFWTKKFILLSILPFFLSFLVFGLSLSFASSEFAEVAKGALKTGEFGYFSFSKDSYVVSFLSLKVVGWVVNAFIYLVTTYFVIFLSLFVAILVAGFMTPIVTKEINKRHYNVDIKDSVSSFYTLKLMGIVLIKSLVLFIISIPFLFIPVVNLFAINAALFYMYYKFLLIDIGSYVLNDIKFKLAYLKNGSYGFIFASFIFYLMSLIPLIGIFFQLFFIIYLSHVLYKKYY